MGKERYSGKTSGPVYTMDDGWQQSIESAMKDIKKQAKAIRQGKKVKKKSK